MTRHGRPARDATGVGRPGPRSAEAQEGLVLRFVDRPDESTRARWDRFVAGRARDVSQLTSWGRVRRAAGFDGGLLLVSRDDHLLAGALVLMRGPRGPGGSRRAVGYVANGPVVDTAADDALGGAVRAVAVEGLGRVARRFLLLVLRPPEGEHDVARLLLDRGFRPSDTEIAPSATVRLDLRRSPEELRRRMSRLRRRGIPSRFPDRVRFRFGSASDVPALARLHAGSAATHGFRPLSSDYLRAFFREMVPTGHGWLVLGEVDGVPVAADLVTRCGDTVTRRVTGTGPDGSGGHLQVPAGVVWATVLRAQREGYRWLDLGGVAPSHLEARLAGGPRGPESVGGPDWFQLSFGGDPLRFPPTVERISPLLRPVYDTVRTSSRGAALIARARIRARGGR